jgi:RHS repeat-associated protein
MEMEKIRNLLLIIFILINFHLFSQDSKYIPILNILCSSNIDFSHPTINLTDGNESTYSSFISGTSEGTIELQLGDKTLIYGLELTASINGNSKLLVEYKKNDQWFPFVGGYYEDSNINGIVDLSYTKTVTDRIRLRLIGSNINQCEISEIKIVGKKSSDVLHRIQPQKISQSQNVSFDQGYITLELDNKYSIKNINLLLEFNDCGNIVIEAMDSSNVWNAIGSLQTITQKGWYKFKIADENINTDKIRISGSVSKNIFSTIRQIEIWGDNFYSGNNSILIGDQNDASADAPVNRQFNLQSIDSQMKYELNIAFNGISSESLSVTLNNKSIILTPSLNIRNSTIYSCKIDSSDLWTGDNFLRINPLIIPQSLIISQLICGYPDGEQELKQNSLNDKLLLTEKVSGNEIIIDLVQSVFLQEIQIYSNNIYTPEVYASLNDNWVELQSLGQVGMCNKYIGDVTISKIKIINAPGTINEVRVLGSPIVDKAPIIKFVDPDGNETLDDTEYDSKIIQCFVDNPDVQVTINGLRANQDGNYFWIKASTLHLIKWYANTITAVATDEKGRTGTDSIDIYYGIKQLFTLDNPDLIAYTDKNTFTISGKLQRNGSQIYINNEEIPVSSKSFSKTVTLNDGLNIITVDCVVYINSSKKFTETMYRKVVWRSTPMKLSITSPLANSYSNQETIIVTGTVEGLGNCSVTINGTTAVLDGIYFKSSPIALSEGLNNIAIKAVDGNGNNTQQSISIIKDSISPVISNISPLDKAFYNQLTIPVNGNITDASPIISLIVNNLPAIKNGNSFNINFNGIEGKNILTISATDAAGNTNTIIRNIFIDITPPQLFTPVVSPASDPVNKSGNNKPFVSFSATDTQSGIDHYNICLDNSDWINNVSSPYQYANGISDGEHLIKVKAVDKSGNSTIGSVNVYIDTSAPEIPLNFEVIPGINHTTIKWDESSDSIYAYRIYRLPAFTQGDHIELLKYSDSSPDICKTIDKYVDTDIIDGNVYTYSIQSIDTAKNFSPKSAPVTIKAGVTIKPVDSTGGTFKFDNCRVDMSSDAIPQGNYNIVIRENKGIFPSNQYAVPVGTVYDIKILDQNGNEIHPNFTQNVTLSIDYSTMTFPDGYNFLYLGIYWYNELLGQWEKQENTKIDQANKKINLVLSHFSLYQPSVSLYTAPDLSEYDKMGISPAQSYFKDHQEFVNTQSGSLCVDSVDMRVPGRDGFDVVIKRTYNSSYAFQIANSSSPGSFEVIKNFGTSAWSLNVPFYFFMESYHYLRLPDGSTVSFKTSDLVNGTTYSSSSDKSFAYNVSTKTLTMSDGTVYNFDGNNRVSTCVSPSRKNTITYYYKSNNQIDRIQDSLGRSIYFTYDGSNRIIGIDSGTQNISYTYDSTGNLASFDQYKTYKDPTSKISTVYNYYNASFNINYTTYSTRYLNAWEIINESTPGHRLYNTIKKLKIINETNWPVDEINMRNMTMRGTQYSVSGKDYLDTSKNQPITLYLLNSIKYPTNAVSTYGYNTLTYNKSTSEVNDGYEDYCILITDGYSGYASKNYPEASLGLYITQLNKGQIENNYRYSGFKYGDDLINIYTWYSYWRYRYGHSITNSGICNYTVSSHNITDKDNNTLNSSSYSYSYNGESGSLDNNNYVPVGKYVYGATITESKKMISESYSVTSSSSTILASKSISDNVTGKEIETIDYEYGSLPLMFPTKETHNYGGKTLYSITNIYDTNGNITKQIDGRTDLEINNTYHSHPLINNLVDTKTVKNNDSIVTTKYTYDDTIGKAVTMTVNADSKDIITSYEYDPTYGNLIKVTKPINETKNTVQTIDYDTVYHAFPIKVTDKNIKDANDQLKDITSVYEYYFDKNFGMKKTETNANGKIITYEYDGLNRLIRVILPDDDSTKVIQKTFVFDDTNNTCLYTNEKGQKSYFTFDGLGRLISVYKGTDSSGLRISNFHYNNTGTIDKVIDANNKTTQYEYDAVKRLKKIIYPDSTFATLSYDDSTNATTVIDENGGKVIETKDWANRLINAQQYCTYNNITSIYNWYFTYDPMGNMLTQKDPKSNVTTKKYDALGRMIEEDAPKTILVDNTGTEKYIVPTKKYEYDYTGNKIKDTSVNNNIINYTYDELGRLIKTETSFTDIISNPNETITSVSKIFYDAVGNKIKVTDPNNHKWNYNYSARNYLLSETDPENNIKHYTYDELGNKVTETDPRGDGIDGTFTTTYTYNDFNKVSIITYPDGNFSSFTYDNLGNKLTETDQNNVTTTYTYTPRNKVFQEIDKLNRIQKEYQYDSKGNITAIKELKAAVNTSNSTGDYNITQFKYDSLGRLRQKTYPSGDQIENYEYDETGNQTSIRDGNNNTTVNSYNELGLLVSVTDPLNNITQYKFDPMGNLIQQIGANNLTTSYQYNEINKIIKRTDSLNNTVTFGYDPAGNLTKKIDQRGTSWSYSYFKNNQINSLNATGTGTESGKIYHAEYTYDKAGNLTDLVDTDNSIHNIVDQMNRIQSEYHIFDGATYLIQYTYDKKGLVTGIKYPGATDYLNYKYNSINQLSEVKGFTAQNGISYFDNGMLKNMTYANNVTTNYAYDANSRLSNMNSNNILSMAYTYDNSRNITNILDDGITKTYEYDSNNQLKRSTNNKKFTDTERSEGYYGKVEKDYLGIKQLDIQADTNSIVKLDYNSNSVGIDFSKNVNIKKIELVPDAAGAINRITNKNITILRSSDNSIFIPVNSWSYKKDSSGMITIVLANSVQARYLKIHCKFDDRDRSGNPADKAQFLNAISKMINVYQEASSMTEEYNYDSAGNRIYQRITVCSMKESFSYYYTNSNRVKTDGKYAYKYDAAGNLTEKGNSFTISGDAVIFNATSGDGIEYWSYEYDLLNRLIKVKKDTTDICQYGYDPNGLRVVKKQLVKNETIHYVFEGNEPIFEKNVTKNTIKSYIFALNMHIARVDGVIGDISAKVYYYTTDHLGSIRALTDCTGTIVWNADYSSFGSKSIGDDPTIDEDLGFNGKSYDQDTGLYYYNARWYDENLGRFITEDQTFNGLNWYIYCSNNPVNRMDPTGNDDFWAELGKKSKEFWDSLGAKTVFSDSPYKADMFTDPTGLETEKNKKNDNENLFKETYLPDIQNNDPEGWEYISNLFTGRSDSDYTDVANSIMSARKKYGYGSDNMSTITAADIIYGQQWSADRPSQLQQGLICLGVLGAFVGGYAIAEGSVALFTLAIEGGSAAATKGGNFFKSGELFETSFKSTNGFKVSALAETEVQGTTLTLKNITIYADGTDLANTVGARSFIQLKNQVVQMAQQQGFTKVILQGERVMGSTSANPGKIINQVIDLTK